MLRTLRADGTGLHHPVYQKPRHLPRYGLEDPYLGGFRGLHAISVESKTTTGGEAISEERQDDAIRFNSACGFDGAAEGFQVG